MIGAIHAQAAYKICLQNGIFEPHKYDCVFLDDFDKAKDELFNRGWTFLNTGLYLVISNKWDGDIERQPQKVTDAIFDWARAPKGD